MTALATFSDVQAGFEKPIPSSLHPKVEEFLGRAYRRLCMLADGDRLENALAAELTKTGFDPTQDVSDTNPMPVLRGFARDMIIQAAELKLRNFAGFSSESAGVFSVTRDDYWARGRVTFEPEDLALLKGRIDENFGQTIHGPIMSVVPARRMP